MYGRMPLPPHDGEWYPRQPEPKDTVASVGSKIKIWGQKGGNAKITASHQSENSHTAVSSRSMGSTVVNNVGKAPSPSPPLYYPDAS